MISWIIIVVFIVAGIVLIKMNHFKHRIWIILVVLLVLFLYSTFYIVNTQNKLDFTSFNGFVSSMKIYGAWLTNGFYNFKSLSGNAVKMDWSSTNSSNNNDKVVEVKTVPKQNLRLNERIK